MGLFNNNAEVNMFAETQQTDYRKYLVKVFGWMSLGVFLTFAASLLFAVTGLGYRFYFELGSAATIISLVVQLGVMFYFNSQIAKMNATKARVTFIIYSLLTGVDFSILLLGFGVGTFFQAFLMAAIFFASLAVIGITTKRDLAKLGTICMAGLIAFLLFSLIGMLFKFHMSSFIMGIIGLAIFAGLTAYDAQNIKECYFSAMGDEQRLNVISVFGAFQLYLDFINIFVYILQLIGVASDD